MAIVFKNNATTALSGNITNSATSIGVTDGSVFPSLNSGESFFVTFDDGTNKEIVKVTGRSGNTLTVVRAQDGTSARAFSQNDAVDLRLTAAVLEAFPQLDGNSQTGTIDVTGVKIDGDTIIDGSGNWQGPSSGIKGEVGPTGSTGSTGSKTFISSCSINLIPCKCFINKIKSRISIFPSPFISALNRISSSSINFIPCKCFINKIKSKISIFPSPFISPLFIIN